jgi:hypothetical protein
MFRSIVIAGFVLALSACEGCSGLSTHQQVGVSCETAASALDSLTAAKTAGKIDADQLKDAIRIYEASVVPFCVPVVEDMTGVQRTAFAAAIAELTRRSAGASQ